MKNKYLAVIVMIILSMAAGACASQNKIETKNETKNTEESTEYTYPSEFELTSDLAGALTQLALSYDDFGADVVSDSAWDEVFINQFLMNTRYSFDYLDEITDENNGQINREQAEYIQYSLTGIKKELQMGDEEVLDTKKASSGYTSGCITDYKYEVNGDEVTVNADLEVQSDGTENKAQYVLTAILTRNPVSCFDGYSITSLSDEKVTNAIVNDGEEHTFTGNDTGYEENGVFALEDVTSEDGLNYDHFVYIDLSADDELADYFRKNSGSEFKVTYVLENMESDVISEVVPVSVTAE